MPGRKHRRDTPASLAVWSALKAWGLPPLPAAVAQLVSDSGAVLATGADVPSLRDLQAEVGGELVMMEDR